ncbi:hypothetical protein N7478_003192 [Penicillium angulare]|uniref:uncharacterized protein n=1 Tax=Penicillium angulare TaxID=116970 RepID=UPI0025421E31|nr:uncharacterized protein N7478_003192 [Penicillium angulare]KAJ5287506.1 hypothetical protein N7478_003192 [Penicillium angulare]
MAIDLIKSVKRVMDFELGIRKSNQSNNASIAGYWETCRDGLLSGDALATVLQRLQSVSENTKRWDYDIGRIVSQRQIDPHAFLELRETGTASFQLKESLFDQDYGAIGQNLRFKQIATKYETVRFELDYSPI